VDATAYLIRRSHDAHVAGQLGKIKLFKMLYLASWWAVQAHDKTIFDGPWYRIDMGPALRRDDWEVLEGSLRQRYGVLTEDTMMRHGHSQTCFSRPTKGPSTPSDGDLRDPLDAAYSEIIHLPASAAARLTYTTEPMLWLLAEERANWGASVQYREFNLRNPVRDKFLSLGRKYMEGILEIPDIVRGMGEGWSIHDVVVYLDTFGFSRSINKAALTPRQRDRILDKITSALRTGRQSVRVPAEQKAIASSRIEQEYAPPDSLSG
jgi:hypothetical protein